MRTRYSLQVSSRKAMAAVSLSLLFGCSVSNDPNEALEDSSSTEQAIIGGVDANSSALNAVGSLVMVYRYQGYDCGWDDGWTGGSGTAPGTEVYQGNQRARLNRKLPAESLASSGSGGAGAVNQTTSATGGSTSIGTGTSDCVPVEYVEYKPFCTGTLIGPTAVLTAKHCLLDLEMTPDDSVVFAVGPNAYEPTATYPIVDWDWETQVEPIYGSFFADMGSDVGVAHLGESVTNVKPFAYATPTARDIGTRFTALGYGVQNNRGDYGTRKAGSLTFRGIGGNYADYVFGGFEEFLEQAPDVPGFAWYSEEDLIQVYDAMELLPAYQAFFGGKAGDAQGCYGDSGGPIVATRNGVRTVFGNITNGLGSNSSICDYGTVAAIFGPLTKSYIKKSLKWIDPCDGATVKGTCDGDNAVRCTGHAEGKRRLVVTDCAMLDQTCGLDQNGAAACVDVTD